MTKAPLSPPLLATFSPPVMEARKWLAETAIPDNRPLLNLSQAAPVDPPPPEMLTAMAEMIHSDPGAHVYGPVLGLPALREEVAAQWSAQYGGEISAADIAITSGCNQAFCAAVMSLATSGDAVILPTPWYFNHKMWLDMAGIETRALPCEPDMTPSVEKAEALIGPGVKAIVLVTPNNPTGAEYPAGLVAAFAELARKHGLALILDETYRNFHSAEGAPHALFTDPDWRDTLIHLYSFSKVYRLTGHRVGLMAASPERLCEIEKFLDTMTICANQIGQRAALFGLRHLGDWAAGERAEILRRRAATVESVSTLEGWKILGSGAYFAYLEHPFDLPSDVVARRLVEEQSLLLLPGTMFGPTISEGGDGSAERQLRVAFANADLAGIRTMTERLAAFRP
jgi:aspartate/methionine/tyrosine aminotransferase